MWESLAAVVKRLRAALALPRWKWIPETIQGPVVVNAGKLLWAQQWQALVASLGSERLPDTTATRI